MLQQVTIPKIPEEVAANLRELTKEERQFVNGVIYGLNEARRNFSQQPSATERIGA